MKTQFIFILTIYIMGSACNQQKSKAPVQWSEKELSEWLNNGEWKQGGDAWPDESLNKKEFARLYFQNLENWNKAFQFLSEQNLAELKKGRYELEGANLFINVEENVSKNEEVVLFEAHKKYADIQVVVSGEEEIGVLPLENTTITIPNNEEKDIVFLTAEEEIYRTVAPGTFFLFFPKEAYRPTVKFVENIPVRKIVVKVRIS